MNRTLLSSLLIVLVLGGAWWFLRGDRDARRIHARMDALVEAVEKTESEGHIRVLARAQSIPGFFTTDATIHLDPLYSGTLTRRDIASYVVRIHGVMDRFTVRISERTLDIDTASGTAIMRFTARGRIELGNQSESHAHAFEVNWVKEDGDWYIQRAATVQAIRRPGT